MMIRESASRWSSAFDAALVIRYTRHWLHYGAIAFVVLCTVVGAIRGVAGR